jgi:hypothetical protein
MYTFAAAAGGCIMVCTLSKGRRGRCQCIIYCKKICKCTATVQSITSAVSDVKNVFEREQEAASAVDQAMKTGLRA